jgi:hypothetical protein
MSVIVVATGLVGFGVSTALLAVGMTSMGLRYLLAVALGYTCFLVLVRLWVERERRAIGRRLVDGLDLPDVGSPISADDVPMPGGEGSFGGGGAGRAWELDGTTELSAGLDVDADADALVLLPAALVIVGVVAVVAVIWTAPALLAELLLDALLVSGLYRRLRNVEAQPILGAAVRRTWMPATAVALVLAGSGFVMQRLVPSADSIGDVVRALAS